MKLPRYLAEWLFSDKPALSAASALDQFERDIEAALALRKSRRGERSQAAKAGWRTRKSNFNRGSI